ncbi:MAG TPA: hypothetical protein VM261_23850 [Kofleriaceae bacterium]|nr:hypothetical protein [Kofleriaceae bacterium]
MKRPLLLALASAITILPFAAHAAPSATPMTRTVHLEISDPGDPAGGLVLDTSLVGERACSTITLDDRTTRRKVSICTGGSAEHPFVDLRLERGGAAGAVDVQFAAVTPNGARTRLGKVALDTKRSLEAHATVTTDAP